MAKQITFKGKPITVPGAEITVGSTLPAFTVTANDLSDISSQSFAGKKLVIVTVPSLDTPVCALETKRFNQEATSLGEAVVLVVSMDLPFAQKRWCGAEGVKQVITASDYKYRQAATALGVGITELGLLTRAVFVVNEQQKVTYVEYVAEVTQEPAYELALKAVRA